MTKILTRKCSIPDNTGDIKEARCDFNILYYLQMDIELYNYCDLLFYNYRNGKLDDIRKKKRSETIQNENGFNAAMSFLLMGSAPPGLTFKRDNADFMNNFFVDIVCRSFTNIEEIHRQNIENIQQNKQI